jgi:endonuclease III
MASRANPNDVLGIFSRTFRKFRSMHGLPLLERLLYLLLGRDVPAAKVDPVLERLKKEYVDWNEVRLARVDDLREIIASTGAPDAELRAIRLRDLLTKVFTDRHALDVEFLRDEDRDKRTLFLASLPGLHFAQAQAFEASLAQEKDDIPVSPHALRVAQRLGWVRGSAVTKAKKILSEIGGSDPVNLVYGLVRIAEDTCFVRHPNCPACPLQPVCPVGRKWKATAARASA